MVPTSQPHRKQLWKVFCLYNMKNPTGSLTQGGRNGDIFPGFQLMGTGIKVLSFLFNLKWSFSEAPSGNMVFFLLLVSSELDLGDWSNRRHEDSPHLNHLHPAEGPAPCSLLKQCQSTWTSKIQGGRHHSPSQPNGGLWRPTKITTKTRKIL